MNGYMNVHICIEATLLSGWEKMLQFSAQHQPIRALGDLRVSWKTKGT